MNRNPRRAYDKQGREIKPGELASMRRDGIRSVLASCVDCRRDAIVNVDGLPDVVPVPDARRMRCSVCSSKNVLTRPNWQEQPKQASILECQLRR